jgi:hypothetical protein
MYTTKKLLLLLVIFAHSFTLFAQCPDPDETDPTMICQDITVELDANGEVTISPSQLDNGSFDDCGIVLLQSTTDFDCDDLGANPVRLFGFDNLDLAIANIGFCDAIVTVVDNLPPSIADMPSSESYTVVSGTCGAVATWTEPTASDNAYNNIIDDPCTGLTLTSDYASGDTFPLGATIVTYTATDGSGNETEASFTITVTDNEAPAVTGSITASDVEGCSASDAPVAATSVAGLEALTGDLQIADACTADGLLTVTSSDASDGNTCPEVITRTYTITDEGGNFVDITHTITVDDNTAPVIVAPDDIAIEACTAEASTVTAANSGFAYSETSVTLNAGDVTTFLALQGASVTEACDYTVTYVDSQTGTCPVLVTRTYTITDACGNTTNDTQTITVDDDTLPVIVAPDDIAIEACTAEASTVTAANSGFAYSETSVTLSAGDVTTFLDLTGASVTEACDYTVTYVDSQTGTCPVLVTRTYTITDACGNTTNDNQTITVDDDTLPVIVAPDDIAIEACTAEASTVTAANSGFAYSETSVTLSAGDVTTFLDLTGASVTEACDYTVTYVDSQTGTCPVLVTRTYTITDACGNTTNDNQTITVGDATAPVIVAPDDIAIEACTAEASTVTAANSGFAYSETLVTLDVGDVTTFLDLTGASVTEACDYTVTYVDSQTGTFPVLVTRTYTITDACGATTSDNQTITVDDTTAPAVTGSITASDVEGCSASDAPVAATSVAGLEALTGDLQIADACTADGLLTVTSSDASDGNTCPEVITRTYTITDEGGNFVDITHTITVDDNTAPVIVAPDDIAIEACTAEASTVTAANSGFAYSETSVTLNAGDVTTFLALQGASVTEACDYTVTYVDSQTGTCPVLVTRTYTITDACGNTTNDTQTITVDDDTLPVIVAPDDIAIEACTAEASTVTAANSGFAYSETSVTLSAGDVTTFLDLTGASVTEACDYTVTYVDSQTGTCPVLVTRTYTITDACGNTTNDNQTITVDDDTLPVIVAPDDIAIEACTAEASTVTAANSGFAYSETSVTLSAGDVTTFLDLTGASVTEACDYTVTYVDSQTGTCPVLVTRTYTITDACGNTTNDNQTITVGDATAPVIVAPDDIAIEACTAEASTVTAANSGFAYSETLVTLDVGDVTTFLDLTGASVTEACDYTVTYVDSQTGTFPVLVTRTYTITDACGATTSDNQTITVDDTTAPAVTGSITASDVEGCSASDAPVAATSVAGLEALAGDLAIADACTADGLLTVTSSDASDGNTCPEVITRTYTITDEGGNFVDITHTITVDDNTAPVVTGSITDSTIEGCDATAAPAAATTVAGLEALAGDLAIADACTDDGLLILTSSDASDGNTCPEVITRTYIVTDACSNASVDIVHTITVADTIAPAVTGSITASTIEGCSASDAPAETTVAGLEALDGNLTIADACTADGALVVTSSDVSDGNTCPEVITRTYTITDACSNSSVDIIHTITVDDTTAPTLTATAANSTVECDGTADPSGAFAAWLGSYGGASASDACTASVLDQDNFDPQTTNIPVPGYNYDANGDEFYQSFTAGQTGVLSSFSIKGYYSGYTNVTIRSGEGIGGAALYTGVWYITNDGSGSSTFDLTTPTDIVAGQVYSIQLQAGELSGYFQGNDNYAGGQFYWDGYGIYGDLLFRTNVSESILTWSNNSTGLSDTCGATGSETVTFTVADACGNETTTTATFTIEDTTAPVVSGTITASTVEGCDATDAPAAETTVAGLEALDGEGVNLDQKNEVYTSGAIGPSAVIPVTDWYQSFTAGLTGPLTSFSFRKNGSHSGVFDVTIHAGDGNTGPVLYTGQWTFDNTPNNWMTYDLTSELNVVAGEMYSIQLFKVSCTDGTCGMLFHGSTAGDTYTGGSFNGPYGGSPNNNDLMFRTYVNSGVLISDSCSGNGELTVTSSDTTSGTCPLVITRTYTVTDACSNESVDLVHTITVEDTTAPVVTGSITASTVEGCDASAAPAAETSVAALEALDGNLAIADACSADGLLTVTSSDASAGTCPLVITRTYTVTDPCSDTSVDIVHTINVDDTTAPTLTAVAANSTVECDGTADPAGAFAAWLTNNGGASASDSCSGVTWSNDSTGLSDACGATGFEEVTFTATDACGNETTTTATFTIEDSTAPVITCPDNISVSNDAGNCSAVVTFAAATATDSCGSVTVTQTEGLASGSAFPVGVSTIKYTAEDECGLTTTCSFTVTVEDNEVPTITCAADQTANTNQDLCTANVTVLAPTTTDNCGAQTVTNNFNGTDDASGIYPIGTTTVVWTVDDGNGQTATCSMEITVTDNQAPTANCKTTYTAELDANGNLTLTGADINDGSTDNCTADDDLILTVSTPNTFDCSNIGDTVTVILTVEDAAGLTDTCTTEVTIADTVDPIAVCQNITVELDANGEATITAADVDNGSSDACGGPVTLNIFVTDFDCDDLGAANNVLMVVTDESDNSSTCTAVVTVVDLIDPTITCAADQTQNLDAGLCTAAVTVDAPTIGDNCSIASITNDFNSTADASGDYPLGTTVVIWTVTDTSGNTAECSMNITVTDNQNPVLVCQNITVELDANGEVSITENDLIASITDCSSIADYTITPRSDFDCDNLGANNITLIVEDAAGNLAFCASVVTVEDNTAPTIVSIPGDITVDNDSGACGAVVSWIAPTASDNCSVATFTSSHDSGDTFPVGQTTVTYTATDATIPGTAANVTTASFIVTVTDVEGPSISCPADISVPGTSSAGAVVTFTTPVGTDQCSGSVTTQTAGLPSGSTFPLGTTTNTFEVTDPSGLTSSCSFTVEVTGVPPSIVCPADIVTDNDSGNCDAIVTFAATDTTGVPTSVITYSQDPGTAFPVGTTTVTATATNSLGTDQCSFTITVNDTQNPVWVIAPSDLTVQCDGSGNTTEFSDWLNNTFTGSDNCTVVTVTNDSTGLSDDCGATGTETVTFTLTDSNTNSITLDATFTIEDTTVPTLTTAAANSTVQCDGTSDPSGTFAAWLSTNGGASASDVCSGVTWTNDSTGLSDDCGATGTETVTFTATDACGNFTTTTATFTIEDTANPTMDVAASDSTVECDGTADPQSNTQDGGLLITAIADANDNTSCRFVEIHNSSLTAIDLSGYALQRWTNNNSSPSTVNNIDLSSIGTLGPSEYAWIANNADFASCYGFAPNIVGGNGGPVDSNGDDQIAIIDGSSNIIDIFGVPGEDGTGTCHEFEDGIALRAELNVDPNAGNWNEAGWIVYSDGSSASGCTNHNSNQEQNASDISLLIGDWAGEGSVVPPSGAFAAWLANNGGASASDACSGVTWTNDSTGLSDDCGATGTETVTFTATDACGNFTTTTATFTIEDTANPTMDVAASDSTVECDGTSDPSGAFAAWLATNGGASASDVCSGVTWTNDSTGLSDDCGATGTETVTFTATDACGNFTTTTATFTIEDTANPTMDVAASDSTVECDGTSDPSGAFAAWLANNGGASASDVCSGVTWTNDSTGLSDDCGATGTETVTFTATDACGNFTTTTATFTIEDTANPTMDVAASDSTVECDGTSDPSGAFAAWLANNGGASASDVCSGVTWTNDSTGLSDDCGATGTETVTFTATDACGNFTTTTATFTIEDTANPTMDVAASDSTVECDGTSDPSGAFAAWLANNGGASASDVCSGVTWTNDSTGLSDDCGATGTETVTFTATDACGNFTTTTATFTIEDTANPTMDVAASDSTVECDGTSDPSGAFAAWLANNGGASASDVCSGVTWTNDSTGLSDDCGATGTETVTFTATDACGNFTTTTATFTIEDTANPTMDVAASDSTVECDGTSDPSGAFAAWLANNGGASASDACSGVTWTNDSTGLSDDCGATGTETVTFTATDACGNFTTTTATFTIEDTANPTMDVAASDSTVECDGTSDPSGAFAAWLAANGGASASDVCSGVTWTNDSTGLSDDCGATGTETVTFTATDACGNFTTTTATFTIEDTANPTMDVAASDSTVECDGTSDPSGAFAAWLAANGGASASDVCSGVTWTNDSTGLSDDCGATGTETVTFTATDACGNFTTTTATFTIEDTANPTMDVAASDSTVECDGTSDPSGAFAAWLANNGGASASDACSGVTWTNDSTGLSDDCGATGTETVTLRQQMLVETYNNYCYLYHRRYIESNNGCSSFGPYNSM